MEQISIDTIEDVRSFFQLLYDKYDLNFHPDDPFADYVNQKGERLFSDEEASQLDQVMEKCFEVCETVNVDIYQIGLEVQQDQFKKRGIAILNSNCE
jgi:hypothetical protein